jgi:hypothetical protein
MSRGTI